jgi:hypothetical protein
VALNFDRLEARKASLLPRPPVPTEKFPFHGSLWTADNQRKLGPVRGLFFRGLEKGDPTWRGQIEWESAPQKILHAGDTACLHRDGFDHIECVVMGTGGHTLTFRCCASGSPLVPKEAPELQRS